MPPMGFGLKQNIITSGKSGISLVNHGYSSVGVSGSQTYTIPWAQTKGNLIVLPLGSDGDYTYTINSITDTVGNTYRQAIGKITDTNDNIAFYLYYAYNIGSAAANANTITASFTGNGGQIFVSEWSNALNTSSPLGNTANYSSDVLGDASSYSLPLTTTMSDCLLFNFACWAVNTEHAGSGFIVIDDSTTDFALDTYIKTAQSGTYYATGSNDYGGTNATQGFVALAAIFNPA